MNVHVVGIFFLRTHHVASVRRQLMPLPKHINIGAGELHCAGGGFFYARGCDTSGAKTTGTDT